MNAFREDTLPAQSFHSQSYISVKEVPVSLVVHGHNVHGDVILLVRVQSGDLYSHRRKHPPEGEKNHKY